MKQAYGVTFSDMSPFRAIRLPRLRALEMAEADLWLESRNADEGSSRGATHSLKVPVDHRCRRGGVSKVSGNLIAGLES